jgi:D-alanyl-D-alanine carboxypeptidase (penicillin-binding protein 5/6)
VAAKSFLLLDFQTGQVLLEKDADLPVEPASLTKLMTAYIVFKQLKEKRFTLTDTARVSQKAWQASGSRTYLQVNHDIPIELLIQGMIVQSGNDATVTLAEKVAGSEEQFVGMMNEQGKLLGLTNTHFSNSTGLPDPTHRSTARDLSKIAAAIIRDFPEYYRWYSQRDFTYNNITQPNRNLLLERDKSVDGMKTGHTDSAGFCLVASAKRENTRLISVILGAKGTKERADESAKILEYGFSAFETHLVQPSGQMVAKQRVWYGDQNELLLGLNKPLYITVPKGKFSEVSTTITADPAFYAPVAAGKVCGHIKLSLGTQVLDERPLLALNTIKQGSLIKQLTDYIAHFIATW